MYIYLVNNYIKMFKKFNVKILLLLIFPVLLFAKGPFEQNYLTAREKAIATGKSCLIFFTEDGNKSASWMEEKVFTNQEVSGLLEQNYICASMNVRNFDATILMSRFLITKAPAIGIIDASGKIIASINRGMTAEEFATVLSYYTKPENAGKSLALSGSAWEAQVAGWQDYKPPVPVQATTPVSIVTNIEPTLPQNTAAKEKISEKEKPVVNSSFEAKKTSASDIVPVTTGSQPNITAMSWAVQTGVFSTMENATQQVQKLKSLGYAGAYYEAVTVNQKTLYKVLSGKFSSATAAQSEIDNLSGVNIKGILKQI